MSAKKFFSKEQQQHILEAIVNAELSTSGEVRVHIDNDCKEDVLDRAVRVFHKFKMHKTELRNGVLFYLAVNDRKFAVLGDRGINEKVPPDFWDQIKNMMLDHFKKQEFSLGLCKGIEQAGDKLKTHFPFQKNDSNELSNEVSFGKDPAK